MAMMLKRTDDIFWMQFPGLAKAAGIWHGIFLRLGGVSPAPYASLNVGRGGGDAEDLVTANRRRITKLLPPGELHTARQVHASTIVHISKAAEGEAGVPSVGDAMITRDRRQFLMIQVADCQAVMLFDRQNGVVANIHSGWRGSIADIIGKTVAAMAAQYNCRPEHILAGIGPSLGPCCAEFLNYQTEIPHRFWKYKDGRDHFDFWSISRDQLMTAGIPAGNIDLSHICTRCNPHLFFSYRAQRQTGRFAAIIGLT